MASTSAFLTVLFENLFLFLLGVFAGAGTTLFYAVYIVAQTVKSCDKLLNGSSLADQSSSSPAQTSCYSLFGALIGALAAVALAFALGKSWRYCQRQDSAKTSEIIEQKTTDQSDTEAENSLQTNSESGGKNPLAKSHHLLTPRLASTLIPSNLDSKSNTSIRTDATLKRK